MASSVIPLEDLAQRIARQEAELKALRQEEARRRVQLTKLSRRKNKLESQLRRVETQIASLRRGQTAAGGAAKASRATNRMSSRTSATGTPSLPDMIVRLVQEANGQPLTLREITARATKRGFVTSSTNLYEIVKVRAGELVRKGVLRRAPGRAGLTAGRANTAGATPAARPVASSKGATQKKRKSTPAARSSNGMASRSAEQPSLRSVLLDAMKQASRPLFARELAEKAKAKGYRSGSSDFTNLVGVTLGKMDEVERAPEGGYRLKKRKA